MSAVTILCPNNRRVVVKLEAGKTTLFQVLDEACKKQGYESENYGLKHHNRFVDLSLPFRLTGLPHNCTLEMVERVQNLKEEVEIALQMPDGSRVTKKIPVDATLLDLLLDCEKESGLKLLEPDGENIYPVCSYLNNDFVGTLALAATTLKSIGIRGRALFRYTVRSLSDDQIEKINESIEEAHAKQRKLEETFERKKQENEEYEQQKQQEAALINQLASVENSPVSAPVSSFDNCSVAIPMDLTPSSTVSPSYATAPANQNAASNNDAASSYATQPAPSTNYVSRQARLDALQQMLHAVDHSIEQNTDLPWDFDNRQAIARNNDGTEFANFKFPEATRGVDLTVAATSNSASTVVQPCDRRAIVYRVDDKFDIGLIEPPEEFFEITANDVQSRRRGLLEQSGADNGRPLFSESVVRERDMQNKRRAWKCCVLRVYFSDGYILQGTFHSTENVSALYEFVKGHLADSNAPFKLSLPPNVGLDNLQKNFIEAGLAPRANVICRIRQNSNTPAIKPQYLKSDVVALSKSQAEAELTAHECLIMNEAYVPYRPPLVEAPPAKYAASAQEIRRPTNTSSSSGGAAGGSTVPKSSSNLPKWFKGPS